MTYLKDASSCKVTIGRTDVYDHRNGEENLFERPRLPLGYFEVKLSDNIIEATGKINLYNARELCGTKTNSGNIRINAITFSEEDYILLQIDDQNYKTSMKLSGFLKNLKAREEISLMLSNLKTIYPIQQQG